MSSPQRALHTASWLCLSAVLMMSCSHTSSFRLDISPSGVAATDCARDLRVDRARSLSVSGGPRTALVIGNNAYDKAPLQNAIHDAEEVAERLRRLGFAVALHLDVTREVMKRAISDFRARRADAAGLALFYYSGHGMQVDGLNYLIPVDADIEDEQSVEFEAVAAEQVFGAVSSGGGYSIAILDACRDNPFGNTTKGSKKKGLAAIRAPDSMLVAYATAPGETADDSVSEGPLARSVGGLESVTARASEPGHGAYTGALLRHLDAEGLTVEQMLKRTAADVRAATKQRQRPWTATDWVADVFLNPQRGKDPQELIALLEANMEGRDYLSVVHDSAQLLDGPDTSLSEPQRAQVQALRDRAQARVSRVSLQIHPSDATLHVGGSLYRSNDGNMCLNPGEHKVEISEAGYQDMTRGMVLGEGSTYELRAKLGRQQPRDHAKWLAWSLAGLSVTSLATSLGTRIRAGTINSELNAKCAGNRCPVDGAFDWRAKQQTGKRLVVGSGVTLATGLISLTAGVMLMLRPDWFGLEREPSSRAEMSCDGVGCQAHATWSF